MYSWEGRNPSIRQTPILPHPLYSVPTSVTQGSKALFQPWAMRSPGGRGRRQGVAATLHRGRGGGRGGKEGGGGTETSGPSREGGWRRQLLPPRLSLSAGFTWIGRFICNRAQGGSVRADTSAPKDTQLFTGT